MKSSAARAPDRRPARPYEVLTLNMVVGEIVTVLLFSLLYLPFTPSAKRHNPVEAP